MTSGTLPSSHPCPQEGQHPSDPSKKYFFPTTVPYYGLGGGYHSGLTLNSFSQNQSSLMDGYADFFNEGYSFQAHKSRTTRPSRLSDALKLTKSSGVSSKLLRRYKNFSQDLWRKGNAENNRVNINRAQRLTLRQQSIKSTLKNFLTSHVNIQKFGPFRKIDQQGRNPQRRKACRLQLAPVGAPRFRQVDVSRTMYGR